jgi:hypothetical protein
LEDIRGIADTDLAVAIRKMRSLTQVSLRGEDIGEKAIVALSKLEIVEELAIACPPVDPDVLSRLSDCSRLCQISITCPSVDDAVLGAFMRNSRITHCFLYGDNLTADKVAEFRQKRPDVALVLLSDWSSIKVK